MGYPYFWKHPCCEFRHVKQNEMRLYVAKECNMMKKSSAFGNLSSKKIPAMSKLELGGWHLPLTEKMCFCFWYFLPATSEWNHLNKKIVFFQTFLGSFLGRDGCFPPHYGGNSSSNRDCCPSGWLQHQTWKWGTHDPSIMTRHFAMNFPPGFQNCHELEVDQWDLERGSFCFGLQGALHLNFVRVFLVSRVCASSEFC